MISYHRGGDGFSVRREHRGGGIFEWYTCRGSGVGRVLVGPTSGWVITEVGALKEKVALKASYPWAAGAVGTSLGPRLDRAGFRRQAAPQHAIQNLEPVPRHKTVAPGEADARVAVLRRQS